MDNSGGKINFKQLILRLRWPVIALIGIFILVIEVFEHPEAITRWDGIFTTEVIILESLLVLTGVAFGWLIKLIGEKTSKVDILQVKSDLSLQLSSAQDWDQITTLLVEYPGNILLLRNSSLLVYSVQKDQFEPVAFWSADSNEANKSSPISMRSQCFQCIFDHPFVLRTMESSCSSSETGINLENLYCMPLSFGDDMRAMLQLQVPPGSQPTTKQAEILNNLGPIMAIAMRAARENQIREQLAAEKAAQEVRRAITRDMHDMLAQNLAYMQIKLDQFSQQEYPPEALDLQSDLHKLSDVAGESYELIRNTLAALHPSNRARLGEILSEYAKIFTNRSDLKVRFTQEGQSQPLDPLLVHNIHQLFREALNNIDHHAQANLVETSLVWMDDQLTMTIRDDGCGFETRAAMKENHFGLEIMQERVELMHGEIWINSSPGCGSITSISIPILPINEIPVAVG
ncbi:MAG: sensor histidine kinase [Anaerolineales bacterium]